MSQVHKANQHSGSHANVAVNRAWKRAKVYTGPNRAQRRTEMRADLEGSQFDAAMAINQPERNT